MQPINLSYKEDVLSGGCNDASSSPLTSVSVPPFRCARSGVTHDEPPWIMSAVTMSYRVHPVVIESD